jgi:hypothetical protein
MSAETRIPRRSPSIIARRTGDEYVLVPVTNNIADMTSMYTLNETGAFIWDLIDGERSVQQIAAAMAAEYEIDAARAQSDVEAYLAELHNFLITEQ